MKTKSDIKELLWRYFEGNATLEEADYISEWLDKSEENNQQYVTTKKAFIEVGADLLTDPEIVERAYNRFQDRIHTAEWKAGIEKQLKNKKLQSIVWRYAAIFIFLLGTGILLYVVKSNRGSLFSNAMCELQVPYGARSQLTLPDGSMIWLNAGSKIKYNRDFGINSRDVYLNGEAYFDVEKSKHPFIVHTSYLDLKVLGTSFNVKAYPDEELIEATLVKGSIRVENKSTGKPLYLKPREKLTFNIADMKYSIGSSDQQKSAAIDSSTKDTDVVKTKLKENTIRIKENVNTDEATSWKDGKLVINNEPLEELTRKLERKYDITFVFNSEVLKNYSYSGTLRDFPLEQVLKALELTSPIQYKIKEKTVTLSYNREFKPITKQ
jgi:transmembrane sensor